MVWDYGRGTYVDDVKGTGGVGRQGVRVLPAISVPRQVIIEDLERVDARDVGDLVLHDDGEARTVHRSRNEATNELVAEKVESLTSLGVVVSLGLPLQVLHGGRKSLDHVLRGLVESPALAKGDHVGQVPRELLDHRDHGVDAALRAAAAEGDLDEC